MIVNVLFKDAGNIWFVVIGIVKIDFIKLWTSKYQSFKGCVPVNPRDGPNCADHWDIAAHKQAKHASPVPNSLPAGRIKGRLWEKSYAITFNLQLETLGVNCTWVTPASWDSCARMIAKSERQVAKRPQYKIQFIRLRRTQ